MALSRLQFGFCIASDFICAASVYAGFSSFELTVTVLLVAFDKTVTTSFAPFNIDNCFDFLCWLCDKTATTSFAPFDNTASIFFAAYD